MYSTVYHLLGPMILMNMLTGYMGNTFSKIVGNMDAIWKFNRAQVRGDFRWNYIRIRKLQ